MKIYVEELPKSCEDCCFSETGFVWDSEVRFCKLKPRCMNWIALYDKKRKDCPLQSLADHDKQVRKEVCKKIRTELIEYLFDWYEEEDNANSELYIDADRVWEILDQVQGETK